MRGGSVAFMDPTEECHGHRGWIVVKRPQTHKEKEALYDGRGKEGSCNISFWGDP